VLPPRAAHALAALSFALACSTFAGEAQPYRAEAGNRVDRQTLRGWQVLRQFDCARCHGKDYDGAVGPSLIDYVERFDLARFERDLLDGNPGRGMPGYRGINEVAEARVGIFAYLRARADRAITGGGLSQIEP
jgi:mono/diheme cytochrome c family protein